MQLFCLCRIVSHQVRQHRRWLFLGEIGSGLCYAGMWICVACAACAVFFQSFLKFISLYFYESLPENIAYIAQPYWLSQKCSTKCSICTAHTAQKLFSFGQHLVSFRILRQQPGGKFHHIFIGCCLQLFGLAEILRAIELPRSWMVFLFGFRKIL